MNERQNSFSRTWLPVLLWMLFIFILSSVTGKNIPDLPIPAFHRVVHFFEYAVLGGLCLRAFLLCRPGEACLKLSILAWGMTAVFALSDEWHQTFVFGRSGKLEDAIFDGVCSALGILLYVAMRNKSGNKNSQKGNTYV